MKRRAASFLLVWVLLCSAVPLLPANAWASQIQEEGVSNALLECQHTYLANPAVCDNCDHERISISIESVVLKPSDAGVYFKGIYAADSDVKIAERGVVVSVSNALPVADDSDPSSLYTTSTASVLVRDILLESNAEQHNEQNVETPIFARAYVLLESGIYIYSDAVAVTFQQVLLGVDAKWKNLNSTQKDAVATMYETFIDVLQNYDIPNIKENSSEAYALKSVTDTVVVLSEKDPREVSVDLKAQKTTIHGRNLFNIDSAAFSFKGGYSSRFTLTKENEGIKVKSTLAGAGIYTLVQTEFIAPFDGFMYVSCEADCTGPVRDVCFNLYVNGVEQTKCYGKGLLYQAAEVVSGDVITMGFYTHMASDEGNTIYYKNIQVSYGGLYDFAPYHAPISNEIQVQAKYNLPADAGAWSAHTTSGTGGLYRFVCNTPITDLLAYPTSQDAVPGGITVTGAELVTYNETYKGIEGVGIDKAGKVSIYLKNVQTRADLAAYLVSNPITIFYDPTESITEIVDIEKSTYYQGEILEFETAQAVSYKYKPQEKSLTCVCFGDSITGMYANKTDYPSMMEMGTDLICYNVGFSGAQFTDHTSATYRPFSMNRLVDAVVSGDFSAQEAKATVAGGLYPERLETLMSIDFNEVDFVTILYGTNDWYSGKPLQSTDDTSAENKQQTNVEDALKYSIATLLAEYPHLKIIVLTPYWRAAVSGKDSDVDANRNGVYLYEYADYIQKVAEDIGLPTINLYRTLGVNAATNRYFTSDGTHPTEWTKHLIAELIIKEINENR